jgi:micrococcal nuclease
VGTFVILKIFKVRPKGVKFFILTPAGVFYRISSMDLMKKSKNIFLAIFILLVIPCTASAWQGKVVGVSDGDTITVMHNGKGENIRLYGVDCPEKKQDFGQKAKQFTSSMVFGKAVDVESVVTDRYGRTVGIVTVEGKNLSKELIKNGLAWVYTQYCKKPFCSEWENIQKEAQKNKTGLWSIRNPIPPWEFRHGKSPSQKTYNNSFQHYSVYHGNMDSKVFHRTGCKYFNCTTCTAIFKTKDQALAAGYKPCGMCKP